MPANWVPKAPKQKAKPEKNRRIGCRACPTTGVAAGASVAWCESARGEWCGECQFRHAKSDQKENP